MQKFLSLRKVEAWSPCPRRPLPAADLGLRRRSRRREAEQRIAQIARTRRGRHRDRALASWRRTRAIELRATGLSYDQVAAEVGYTNRGTAYNVVTQALAAREAQSVDHMRDLKLARLEAAHAALWPRAMQGHVPSVAALLRILDLQCRLQGLYEPVAKPGPKGASHT